MYPVPGSTPPRAPGGASLLSPSGSVGGRSLRCQICHVFCGIDDVQLQKCKILGVGTYKKIFPGIYPPPSSGAGPHLVHT